MFARVSGVWPRRARLSARPVIRVGGSPCRTAGGGWGVRGRARSRSLLGLHSYFISAFPFHLLFFYSSSPFSGFCLLVLFQSLFIAVSFVGSLVSVPPSFSPRPLDVCHAIFLAFASPAFVCAPPLLAVACGWRGRRACRSSTPPTVSCPSTPLAPQRPTANWSADRRPRLEEARLSETDLELSGACRVEKGRGRG